MLPKENEILFQEFKWATNAGDAKITDPNVKLVSPYFGLATTEGGDNTFRFAICLVGVVADDVRFQKLKTIVYCYVYNAEKFGVKVTEVECTISEKTIPLRLKVNTTILKIFISDEQHLMFGRLWVKGISLKYRLHLTNNFDQRYGYLHYLNYELRDTRFGEEMWSAAQEGVMTDCEFIVQNQKFLAHRAVVASRSPVLAERIKNSENNNQIDIQDVTNPVVFKALLYFLYTGLILPLDSFYRREFVDVAKNYQVEMAAQIHKVFEQSAHFVGCQSQEFSNFMIDAQSIVQLDRAVDLRENYGSVSVVRRGICLLYDYRRSFEFKDIVAAPATFSLDQGGFFGVTASKITNDRGISHYCELTCSIHLISGFKVDIIKCSANGIAENVKDKTMLKILEDDKVELKLFRVKYALARVQSTKDSHNVYMRFSVYLTETNERWSYRFHDPWLPIQLWSASREKMFTDVELKVGNRTFHVHRAILSARSPVFAAMFGSDMDESHTGIVEIKDIDVDVFEGFLEFLYTGRLKTTQNLGVLWTAANKYDIKTLEEISQPHTVEVEIGAFSVNVL